jgi:hypothetical protein
MFSPKCPNCGVATKRTEDWVCQWCGYPLLSRSFPKIAKTYRQLKQERKNHVPQPSDIITEMIAPPGAEPTTTEGVNQSGEYKSTAKVELELEPNTSVIETTGAKTPIEHKGKVTEPDLENEYIPETQAEQEGDSTALVSNLETTHEIKEEMTAQQNELEAETVTQAEIEVETNMDEGPLGKAKLSSKHKLTIDELFRTYEEDCEATDIKLMNQIIQVTGVVGRIEIKDSIDIPYITLTSSQPGQLQSLRCSFGEGDKAELSKLNRGQTISVQGKYDGSIIDPRMKNCNLIKKGS